MRRTIFRKSDLAREAGVTHGTVTGICRTRLLAAMTPDGKRIYKDHPDVRAYVEHRRQVNQRAQAQSPAQARELEPRSTPAPDPFAAPVKPATMPTSGVDGAGASGALARGSAPPKPKAVERRYHADQALYDLHTGTAGALPEDLEDLGAMTLREVVERFGTLRALADAVKARKDFADMKVKESAAAQRRGTLIDRAIVSATIVPLVDLAFRRLVGEMPVALAEQIIARVMAGGEDLRLDVQAMIRRETSGILTDCRDGVAKQFKEIEGPPAPSKRGRPLGS